MLGKRLADHRGRPACFFLVRPKVKNHHPILFLIHLLFEIALQPDTVNIFEDAEKDRELPGFTIPPEYGMDASQPFRVSNVVAN